MKVLLLVVLASTFLSSISLAEGLGSTTYKNYVDSEGNISLPNDFQRDWVFLGSWSIAMKEAEISGSASGHGAAGLHNVYTQRAVIDFFQKNQKFPDGAVFIKELLKAKTENMTTGTVSRGVEVEGWFVMVKDTKERFSANPLWGDGWGWALFKAEHPNETVTKNYHSECLGCHVPARNDDGIYLDGYPLLGKKAVQ